MTEIKKLTPEQFSDIAKNLPEIRSQKKEITEFLKSKPDRVKEILGEYYSWAQIYELTLVQQLCYLFTLLGMSKEIVDISQSSAPLDALIEATEEGGKFDQSFDLNEPNIDKKHLIWLVVVLQRNILSIMLFHQSLGALVEQVRLGSKEALFKAVSIDRSILSCPTFADRLSSAELMNDKDFFIHLRKALKGPSQKHMSAIGDLRYAIVLLREAGFDKFTDDELIQLFVDNGLYPKSFSAAKNLRKHIQAARKFSTT